MKSHINDADLLKMRSKVSSEARSVLKPERFFGSLSTGPETARPCSVYKRYRPSRSGRVRCCV